MNNNPPAMIIDTSNSIYARLIPMPIKNVRLEDGFWRSMVEINHNVTIPTQYELLESTGRLDNFLRVSGQSSKSYQGYVFNDSDVYKWLEAASWTLAYHQNDDMHQSIDYVIDLIAHAQDKNGYVNSYFSLEKTANRWSNLQEKHELYCAGHLFQAAIAHHRSTGNSQLLQVAVRFADHIYDTFGPNKREGTSGHPEIEMSLIELYRTVGEPKYLELAKLFIDRRGKGNLGGKEYLLDHAPFRQLQRLVGHAVRALYLCSGVTDLYLETGESQLLETLERLWGTMTQQQMYITGGVGSRHEGESIGEPYELPNASAYAETCAAIANLMWNWRLLHIDGNAKYADLMEWTLFNAILPGISLDGRHYFYINPLKDDGYHRRETWFDCACCPPNVSRTLAMIPGYIASASDKGIWLHLYASSHISLYLLSGERLGIRQTTAYPWNGNVRIEITDGFVVENRNFELKFDNPFSLFLRIPGWLVNHNISVKINNQPYENYAQPGSYLEIRRNWLAGDVIEIRYLLETNYLVSHPSVLENTGRVVITRGPLVYCLENADNAGIPLSRVMVDPEVRPDMEVLPDMLPGLVQLSIRAELRDSDDIRENKLYRRYAQRSIKRVANKVEVKAIPYFAWANRQPGEMELWLSCKAK